MRVTEKFTKQLLVEGNDDQHVVWALCERFQIAETFDVIDCGGIENLFNQIPVRTKQSGIEAIGIIIDADQNIASCWLRLSSVLTRLGYTVPNEIPENGLIIKHNQLTFGIWIMPNNSLNGMPEDFMQFLIPQGDELLVIANSSLDQIEELGLNKYNDIHRSKALIHTWLSWQKDPGTPMGASITKRYLTTDSQICDTFTGWLRNTFS